MRPALLLILFPFPALAADPEPLVRLGSDRFRQANRVEALAYSADGKRLVSADDSTIYLWDAADGRLLRTIPTREGDKFIAVHFNADATAVFAIALNEKKDASLLQFDPANGKAVATIPLMAADKDRFRDPAFAFSPDGAWVAVRRGDGREVEVMDTGTRKVVWTERQPENAFYSLAFRADSRVLAVGGWDGQVRLVDPKAGRIIHQYALANTVIWNMTFSADGTDLAASVHSGSEAELIRFEAATGTVRWRYRAGWIHNPFFPADDKALVYFGSLAEGKGPYRWYWLDAATGKRTGHALVVGRDEWTLTAAITGWTEMALRADRRVLALGSRNGHISQWDLVTRKRVDASADPGSPITELGFSADGKVRGWANGWYEWNVRTGAQTRLTPRIEDVESTRLLAGSPDGRWLMYGEQWPELIEVRTRVRRLLIPAPGSTWQFLPNSRLLKLDRDGLDIFDPATADFGKALLVQINAENGTVAASPNGKAAIRVTPTGDHLHGVRFDLITGKSIGEWDARLGDPSMMPRSDRWHADLSPDGRLLAVSFDYLAFAGMGFDDIHELHTALFDARTGRYLSGWYDFHTRADLAFSPDGRTVACCYSSGLGIDIRETVTGQRRMRRSNPPVTSACFTPDGRTLALATSPGPVALWDLFGKPAGKWADQKPDRLWTDLAGDDAERAFDTIRHLRHHPAEAVGFLKERVKGSTAPTAAWLAERVKNLDAPQFRDREKATGELAAAGERIAPHLRQALKTASPEARERINGLLARADAMTPDKLRAIRACEVLEGIGSPDARELLAAWAKGPPGATLTREATESRDRLKGR